jgi:hypothetical protein
MNGQLILPMKIFLVCATSSSILTLSTVLVTRTFSDDTGHLLFQITPLPATEIETMVVHELIHS